MSGTSGLLRADLLRASRDPTLWVLSVVPLLLAAATRALLPFIGTRPSWTIDTSAVGLGAVTALLILTPMMFGFVFALMLLDERDEGVLMAVAHTPLGKDGLLGYRMAAPMIWTAVASLLVVPLSGTSSLGFARLIGLATLAALQAPMLTLFVGAFASNRVSGMGLGKVGSMLIGIGALAASAPEPWIWLATPSPHFWLARLSIIDVAGLAYAWQFVLALCIHLALLWMLTRALRARAG